MPRPVEGQLLTRGVLSGMSEPDRASLLNKERRDIAAVIDESFRLIPYPGDEALVIIRGEVDLERREILETFKGKHWRTLPLSVLRYNHQSLFFFTPAAYRFYLPAYLRATALSYGRAGNIPGSVVFSLTAPETPGAEMDAFLSTMTGFDAAQRSAITSFLEFMIKAHSEDFPGHELTMVMNSFWREFKRKA